MCFASAFACTEVYDGATQFTLFVYTCFSLLSGVCPGVVTSAWSLLLVEKGVLDSEGARWIAGVGGDEEVLSGGNARAAALGNAGVHHTAQYAQRAQI